MVRSEVGQVEFCLTAILKGIKTKTTGYIQRTLSIQIKYF